MLRVAVVGNGEPVKIDIRHGADLLGESALSAPFPFVRCDDSFTRAPRHNNGVRLTKMLTGN